ncbi:hypothetical protein [Candidatus Agathobaculum pullicola]|uniref:hypothetical protein n=1 Tax=Candidatus Agathobaculum pullicola TaxID=2838426 RepID=UPI003F8F4D29
MSYYGRMIGYVPDEEKQLFFRNAIANGLTFDTLWAAIDYAVSVCGYGDRSATTGRTYREKPAGHGGK